MIADPTRNRIYAAIARQRARRLERIARFLVLVSASFYATGMALLGASLAAYLMH